MTIYIITDMEALSGISSFEQCYNPHGSPEYEYGRVQLTADTNAAIAGAFDGGATEVCVLDGHGHNQNKGFRQDLIDKRAKQVWISCFDPVRFEQFDESVAGVMMVGQHAMVGTRGAFLDHTQCLPSHIYRYRVNGTEYGEIGQCALCAGDYGAPFIYLAGDVAACEEVKRQFPWAVTTPVKRGLGWRRCELFPTDQVRSQIRADAARAVREIQGAKVFRLPAPLEITVDWTSNEFAEKLDGIPGVERPEPRTTRWRIAQGRDIYSWPSDKWHPHGTREKP
ncbi:MAG: M55 family metallopeptidase [Verrucomicrobia bacterium]|nr:M55 family metallopeptidase [Verrucomicrobiota bacterium]